MKRKKKIVEPEHLLSKKILDLNSILRFMEDEILIADQEILDLKEKLRKIKELSDEKN